MARVHEVVAAKDELKKAAEKERTQIYHLFQKEDLFNGFAARFEPNSADEDTSTPDEKPVQYQAEQLLRELKPGGRVERLCVFRHLAPVTSALLAVSVLPACAPAKPR
jgi:hypothetical protein